MLVDMSGPIKQTQASGRCWRTASVAIFMVASMLVAIALLGQRHAVAAVSSGARPGDVTPVATPSWWNGMCDVNRSPGSYMVASWDGLIACAPGQTGVLETAPLYPSEEWQCPELAERWLYQEFGLPALSSTNGDQVVAHYWSYLQSHPGAAPLTKVLPGAGQAPGPGDVISYGTSDPGHVAVVIASSVNSAGNGTYTVIQENTAGEVTLNVSNWVPAGE